MEIYELVGVLITVGIFIVALISGFFAIYSFTGVRTNYRLRNLEKGQASLEEGQASLEKGQASINKRMDSFEGKLNELIHNIKKDKEGRKLKWEKWDKQKEEWNI